MQLIQKLKLFGALILILGLLFLANCSNVLQFNFMVGTRKAYNMNLGMVAICTKSYPNTNTVVISQKDCSSQILVENCKLFGMIAPFILPINTQFCLHQCCQMKLIVCLMYTRDFKSSVFITHGLFFIFQCTRSSVVVILPLSRLLVLAIIPFSLSGLWTYSY